MAEGGSSSENRRRTNDSNLEEAADRPQQNRLLRNVVDELKDYFNTQMDKVKQSISSVKLSNSILPSFKYEGNKRQYTFNQEIADSIEGIASNIRELPRDEIKELLEATIKKIEERQKLIRIADRSAAGWDTVKELSAAAEISTNHKEAKLIKKAEERALQARKDRNADNRASKAASYAPYQRPFRGRPGGQGFAPGWPVSINEAQFPPAHNTVSGFANGLPPYTNWGYSNRQFIRPGGRNDRSFQQCFGCGRYGHWRKDCGFRQLAIGPAASGAPAYPRPMA